MGVRLHGEGGEVAKEVREAAMSEFKNSLKGVIESKNIPAGRIFNADQTGLFYQKLPNHIYVDKNERDMRGVKLMKDKTRLTVMVRCETMA